MITEGSVARCSIYENRPEGCQTYPRGDSYRPPECTYYFIGGERMGDCSCDIGACCALPRDKGEPDAKHLPETAGGVPCKHLVVKEKEKTATLQLHPESRRVAIEEAICVEEG